MSCTKTCDNGYEGNQCNVPVNLKFNGIYAITDTAVINNNINRITYSMTITASSAPNLIVLRNFGGTDSSLYGSVSGSSFIIDSVVVGQNKIENTSGNLNDSTLTFTYMVIDSTDTVIRNAYGKK